MPKSGLSYYLGRQPILDCTREIVGYELLFRATDINAALEIDCNCLASAKVISATLSAFGIQNVLGDKLGFINVTRELLLSDMIEILPPKQTVLELLETITPGEIERNRCCTLKELGFRIALDDHVYSADNAATYQCVDIIKIDLLETSPEELPEIVRSLKKFPVALLAERVETIEQFQDCLDLGFHFFQGFFFARPQMLNHRAIDPSRSSMLQLLERLNSNVDIEGIEIVFKENPDIAYQLLKLVNSVALGLREQITSIRHSIMLLGLNQLCRWAQLAVFASADRRGINNPLLEMAAIRGKMMENLVMRRNSAHAGSPLVESAFMVGILSLMDVLFETSMEIVTEHLNLSDEINAALINRGGELGLLLSLAESLELANFGEVESLSSHHDIAIDDLMAAQLDAFNWRTSIVAST